MHVSSFPYTVDLLSLQPRQPGRVGSGLGLDLIRVEVLPALREPRPALGFQSQLGPEIPELIRMSTSPHAGAEDHAHSAPGSESLPQEGPELPGGGGAVSREAHRVRRFLAVGFEPKKKLAMARRRRILSVLWLCPLSRMCVCACVCVCVRVSVCRTHDVRCAG